MQEYYNCFLAGEKTVFYEKNLQLNNSIVLNAVHAIGDINIATYKKQKK